MRLGRKLRPGFVVAALCLTFLGAADLRAQKDDLRLIEPDALNEAGVYEETLQFEVPTGHRGAIFAEQMAADVKLEARWAGQSEPWHVDSPLDFDGVEVLLLPSTAEGSIEVRLTARMPGGPAAAPEVRSRHPSRFRVWFESIPQSAAQRERLDALGRLTAAGRAWAEGDGEGRRRALDLYGRVAAEPAGLAGDGRLGERLTAQAVHCVAVLHRLLGEFGPAREQAEQALDLWRRLGDRERIADSWNELGLVAGPDGRTDEARRAFETALAIAEELDDPFRQAYMRGNLCLVDLMENHLPQGIGCYAAALPFVRWIGDRETESAYLGNMAQAQKVLGEPAAALELYLAALEIQRADGLEDLEARTLNNVADLYIGRGDLEAALHAFTRASQRFENLGDRRWQGRSLHNLATTYLALGDVDSARNVLERALVLHREVANRSGEANALKILGHIESGLGRWDQAGYLYRNALKLERELGDGVGEALTGAFLARTELARGDEESLWAAHEHLVEALGVVQNAGQKAVTALVLCDLGTVLTKLRRFDTARAMLDEALGFYRELGNPRGEGHTLLRLAELVAKANDDTGETRATVLEFLRQACVAFDAVTGVLIDPDLRASFAGSQRTAREKYSAFLVESGDLARALQVSEAARAWGLRTVLGSSPEAPNLAGGAAPNLAEIRQLLDPDTVILQFLVGEETSHVFVVGADVLKAIQLPARSVLETVVQSARRELTSNGLDRPQLEALARLLLGGAWPAIQSAGARRLVLALDGPLHYVPFAALPLHDRDDQRDDQATILVDRFELVRIPSAGVLALERRRRAGRTAPEGFAAVLADPIFSARDLRLPRTAGEAKAEESDGSDLVRLRWSRHEAESVVQAARGKETLVALDAEANRDWLVHGDLARYRILHLATHARIDDAVASGSGLEVSAYDAVGNPRDGFVSMSSLRRLHLRADLVMLSACSTALGSEIRGEGLVGLVQAFLEAGAGRVVASLWPVSDRATAELVEHFYLALAEGSTPAAALRRAQQTLRNESWAGRPVDWAGFVLVGDWR